MFNPIFQGLKLSLTNIFNFLNFIMFYTARKVKDESKWFLGMGQVFKEHRTHAFSGNSIMEPVFLYLEHIINCLLTSKTNWVLFHFYFYFLMFVILKILKFLKNCCVQIVSYFLLFFSEIANQGNLMAFIVYFIFIFKKLLNFNIKN